jgi:hypothetical protein
MSMATIRQWHFYIGMFIAPSVLFFALTGAVQLFSLHEAHGSYDPPPILEKLSAVHKDQVFAAGHHHHDADAAPKPAAAPAGPPPADDDDKPKLTTLLLKSLFLVVALGLTVSTALGLWIGLTHPRYKRAALLLVIAGAVLPVVLLLV